MDRPDELLVALMRKYKKPADLSDDNWLLKQLLTEPIERPKQTEMTEQPDGYLRQNDRGG